MDIKELEIPVPWGHISVKAWGDEQNIPILLLHGYYDNAAGFDRLIPYLPNTFYYICMDLPGHGKSSTFPPHLPIHMLNIVLTLKIVLDYFKRKKYILIGHSWGGHFAIFLTHLYPSKVLKIILLDAFYPYPLSVNYFKSFNRQRLDYIVQLYQKTSTAVVPTYTYSEALNKLIQNRIYGGLKKEAAEVLLSRSLIPVGNGKYKFLSDPRTKAFFNITYDMNCIINLIQKHPITCPIMFIIATDSIPSLRYFKLFLKELQKNNKKCFVRSLQGNHDMHMNQPETVAPIIGSFLTYSRSNL